MTNNETIRKNFVRWWECCWLLLLWNGFDMSLLSSPPFTFTYSIGKRYHLWFYFQIYLKFYGESNISSITTKSRMMLQLRELIRCQIYTRFWYNVKTYIRGIYGSRCGWQPDYVWSPLKLKHPAGIHIMIRGESKIIIIILIWHTFFAQFHEM